MKQVILASTSPRRQMLIRQILGNRCKFIAAPYEEDHTLPLNPIDLTRYHALQKAKSVANTNKDVVIIAADTMIILDGKAIGKPVSIKDAERILSSLSGRRLEVITAIALIDIAQKIELLEHEITKVQMRNITREEIKSYVATGESLDKAGAFGIMEKGAILVERIEGDFYNVVGLPLYRLSRMLEKVGIRSLGREAP
jgi:septum formation protein